MQPVIVVTPGEPAGIGPDVVLALAQQDLPARVLCIADPALMRERASQLGYSIKIHSVENITTLQPHQRNHLAVFPITLAAPVIAGTLNPANAPYVLRCLDAAVKLIQQGEAQALVTGPVHKSVINDAGIPFTGHTEYLAELTHATPVMMLASKVMRVALATTHLPLSQVSRAITFESLEEVIRLLHADLQKKFGIAQPHILVCGLNPHAGEDGHLGCEEIDIITPVLEKLRAQNMNLVGPLPADTLFTAKNLDQADAVLAMYHDQGLPVLKYSSFGEAVNITLGLPIIRTSVDHGTALELAGTGQANVGSLQTAFDLAVELARKSYA